MSETKQLRELLAGGLDWEAAHVGYRRAVGEFSAELRGVVPDGFAHSGWQLAEHIRLAQTDILEFCMDPDYVAPAWPAGYWPAVAPRDEAEWDASVDRYRSDVEALRRLALDERVDLFAAIPWGEGQTVARELLLVADHTAYHVGQLVALRRALGCWR
jgi:hypothetical protein